MSRVNRNPLRRIVAEERDERGVLMQRLDCGHSVTYHVDAGFARRRCPACGAIERARADGECVYAQTTATSRTQESER